MRTELCSGRPTTWAGILLLVPGAALYASDNVKPPPFADTRSQSTLDSESVLLRMRELHRERKWRELVEQFAGKDFAAQSANLGEKTAEAYHLRGQAHAVLKNGKAAESDLQAAVKLEPRNDLMCLSLADNYVNNLQDAQQALAIYRQILARIGRTNGWLSISVTLSIASILTDQVKPDEALEVLKPYGAMDGMAPVWQIKMLRAYGHAYAAQGHEQESLAKFRAALELESPK